MTMTIRTNNVPRDLLYWNDLTSKEQKEFDYLTENAVSDGLTFFRYNGAAYDLGSFQHTSHLPFKGWDGYMSDTYFSGILVKYVNDYEQIIVATYYS
jgi:hypothetical protein